MEIAEAQREMRQVYRNGAMGGFVAGALWLASAAVGTWASKDAAVWLLVFGGVFIFPVTQLALKAAGGPVSLRPENPLRLLAMQVAFMVPLCIPLILALTDAMDRAREERQRLEDRLQRPEGAELHPPRGGAPERASEAL